MSGLEHSAPICLDERSCCSLAHSWSYEASEEEGMKQALAKKNITVEKIKIKASKTQSIENQLQKLAFQEPEIKYLGQRVSFHF